LTDIAVHIEGPISGNTCDVFVLQAVSTNNELLMQYRWNWGEHTENNTHTWSHRIMLPGEHRITLTATDQHGRHTDIPHTLTVQAHPLDALMRFTLRAQAPNRLNHIRKVSVDLAPLGVIEPLELFDNGSAGTDEQERDGIFTGQVRVADCNNIQGYWNQTLTAKAQDASGAEQTLSFPASEFKR
jgi:hypothetical protein